ncbi:hypothetical protein EDD76_10914 [Kineothrix alysoides]|uniref:Uncharacterized protein n=1 Tax=Kineothrix alysoides TaxID=1469948 RepID=A0A4V6NGM5_9FIRM|nr:hypothetical protein [Kineothrix alysoides]TCL57152.1 hypothetical protein EDD76_10914 [Kineothrix alysoides]
MNAGEIEQYNQINATTKAIPNYDLSKREKWIELYFDSLGNVLIVGVVDNNYIHWISKTSIESVKINEVIFNHLANDNYLFVSHISQALKPLGIEFEDLKQYYKVTLIHDKEYGHEWKTPFGHYYGKGQVKDNGRFFANDVKNFLAYIQYKCELRECEAQYSNVLESYIDILSKIDFMYYDSRVKPLQELLEEESYLRISTNNKIKDLYIECMDRISDLYNRYMSAVR